MSHTNIPLGRLARLIRIHDARAARVDVKTICRREGITRSTFYLDAEILRAHSRAELAAQMTRKPAPRPAAKADKRACVYLVISAGKVHACGRECARQYCAEHYQLVMPSGSSQIALSAHVFYSAMGGKV